MKPLNKIKSALTLWQEGQARFDEASKVLSCGPASFYYEKLECYVDALFNKYAPFKQGDRVALTVHPNTDNGWSHCKHFLTPGSAGIVQEVDFYDNHFCADVVFDNESWIDLEGKEQPVTAKHTFRLWENELLKTIP